MNIRASVVFDDDYIPVRPAACSAEPFCKPDYRAKKHGRPVGGRQLRKAHKMRRHHNEVAE